MQFIRFPFTPAEIAAFRGGTGDVIVGFDHPNYSHMAVMPPAVRQARQQRHLQVAARIAFGALVGRASPLARS